MKTTTGLGKKEKERERESLYICNFYLMTRIEGNSLLSISLNVYMHILVMCCTLLLARH